MKLTLLLSLCVWVGSASAQVLRDRVEKANDRQALRADARERRDDRRDTAKLGVLLARFDAARARHDFGAVFAIERELKALLEAEISESRAELSRDHQEVRQDRRELASDRREVRRDVVAGRPLAAAGDRRDLRDDRRDLRDDQRDALVETGSLLRAKRIDAELAGLIGRADPVSLDRTRGLIVELVGMGSNELAGDRREAREDRRELREDRRELREDVRRP